MKNWIQLLALATILLASFTRCEPEPDNMFVRHFQIESGQHYSTPRVIETLQSEHLAFTARFDESAIYRFEDRSMQNNKNKLLGFAECNSQHHENSARFAWQWNNNQLEIYAYCYVNSERIEKFVGTVQINELNRFEIALKDDVYLFYLNDAEPISIARNKKCDVGLYYMLWPYFGGTLPAPHRIQVDIEILR